KNRTIAHAWCDRIFRAEDDRAVSRRCRTREWRDVAGTRIDRQRPFGRAGHAEDAVVELDGDGLSRRGHAQPEHDRDEKRTAHVTAGLRACYGSAIVCRLNG